MNNVYVIDSSRHELPTVVQREVYCFDATVVVSRCGRSFHKLISRNVAGIDAVCTPAIYDAVRALPKGIMFSDQKEFQQILLTKAHVIPPSSQTIQAADQLQEHTAIITSRIAYRLSMPYISRWYDLMQVQTTQHPRPRSIGKCLMGSLLKQLNLESIARDAEQLKKRFPEELHNALLHARIQPQKFQCSTFAQHMGATVYNVLRILLCAAYTKNELSRATELVRKKFDEVPRADLEGVALAFIIDTEVQPVKVVSRNPAWIELVYIGRHVLSKS